MDLHRDFKRYGLIGVVVLLHRRLKVVEAWKRDKRRVDRKIEERRTKHRINALPSGSPIHRRLSRVEKHLKTASSSASKRVRNAPAKPRNMKHNVDNR